VTLATLAGNVQVSVARTREEVEGMRERWGTLVDDSITTDVDYFLHVIDAEPDAIRPHVVLLERNGSPHAAVVARLEESEIPLRIGYRTIYAPRTRILRVVYEGVLGPIDDETARVLVDLLRGALESREADAVFFRHVRVDSPLYRMARERPPLLCRAGSSRPEECRQIVLPETYEEFMASLSRSTRDGVRRYVKRLTREFGDRISVQRFRQPADLDQFFQHAEVVASKTYQRGLGVGLRGSESERSRALLCAERGWFRGYVVYVDGVPVAFQHGELYRGRFRMSSPGYDPAYRDWRIGNFALMQMVEDLCRDPEAAVLDFGFGDAEYKRRFGNRSWLEADVLFFAARVRPIWLNLVRTGLLGVSRAAESVVQRAGLHGRIKGRWRSSRSRGA
jgi:hypothetical protein